MAGQESAPVRLLRPPGMIGILIAAPSRSFVRGGFVDVHTPRLRPGEFRDKKLSRIRIGERYTEIHGYTETNFVEFAVLGALGEFGRNSGPRILFGKDDPNSTTRAVLLMVGFKTSC